MENQDARWLQRFSNFKNALINLDSALAISVSGVYAPMFHNLEETLQKVTK